MTTHPLSDTGTGFVPTITLTDAATEDPIIIEVHRIRSVDASGSRTLIVYTKAGTSEALARHTRESVSHVNAAIRTSGLAFRTECRARALDAIPELRDYAEEDTESAWDALFDLNPSLMSIPLVGASVLSEALRMRSSKKSIRLDLEFVMNLRRLWLEELRRGAL